MSRRQRLFGTVLCIVLVGLAAMVTTVFQYRNRGFEDLDRLIAQRRAAGRPATLQDLLVDMPPLDSTLQHQWMTWVKQCESLYPKTLSPPVDIPSWNHWIVHGSQKPELAAWVEAHRKTMETGISLLRNPQLAVLASGEDILSLTSKPCTLDSIEAENLAPPFTLLMLASWARYSAGLAKEPCHDLELLFLIQDRAASIVSGLIDSMTIGMISKEVDDAIVEAYLRGKLPEHILENWSQRFTPFHDLVARGYLSEAIIGMPGYAESLRNPWMNPTSGRKNVSLVGSFHFWLEAPRDCAKLYDYYSIFGDTLLGHTPLSSSPWGVMSSGTGPSPKSPYERNLGGPLSALLYTTVHESRITANELEARQRALRAYLLLNHASRADDAETFRKVLTSNTITRLLTPPGQLHLAVEWLAPDRIRVGVSPTSPAVPPGIGRVPLESKHHGTPAAADPFRFYAFAVEGPIQARSLHLELKKITPNQSDPTPSP